MVDMPFNRGGTRRAEKYRFNPRFLGGVDLEELIEKDDGTSYWRKIEWPISLDLIVAKLTKT